MAEGFALQAFDINLSQDVSEQDRKIIIDAWTQSGLLLFRGVNDSEAGHMRLSHCFGTPEISVKKEFNSGQNPYLLDLKYTSADKDVMRNAVDYHGESRAGFIGWHWDQAFAPRIIRGAVLRMLVPAATHGETGFIDAIAAYDRLPQTLRERIEGLEVVYQYRAKANPICFPPGVSDQSSGRDDAAMRRDFPPTVHPMVITQRETGRKILKLSPMYADHVLGMTREDSQKLFEEIAEYLLDERHAYFHQWQAQDMIVWDNWRILHSARGHSFDDFRHPQRTTIGGDYALGRYLDTEIDSNRVGRTAID
nr:TauD/TfdA family dioxygenase [Sphingomonas tagetis]